MASKCKKLIWLLVLAVIPIASAISMDYECFGFGGGEDVLAIPQYVGTYGNTYIGCFYPIEVEIIEEEIPEEPGGTYYYEQQQLRNICIETGGIWNGTVCKLEVFEEEKTIEKVTKKTTKIIPWLLTAVAVYMFYRRRKIRKKRREGKYKKSEEKLKRIEEILGE